MQDSGYRIQDVGYRIQDSGLRWMIQTQDAVSNMHCGPIIDSNSGLEPQGPQGRSSSATILKAH